MELRPSYRRSLTIGVYVALVWAAPAQGQAISNLQLTPNPSGRVPLSGRITLETDRPATVSISREDDNGRRVLARTKTLATRHELSFLGLLPDTRHALRVEALGSSGNVADGRDLELTTEALPDDFPPVQLTESKPEKMEPGITLIPLFKWGSRGPSDDYGLVVGVDARGKVVWYLETDHTIADLVRNGDGNFVYQVGRSGTMYEIDKFGNEIRRWDTTGIPKDVPPESIPVEAETFHHDMAVMPSGHYLMLSTEVRHYAEWPSSEIKPHALPKPADVIGDTIIEFRPDGQVVRRWSVLDILDPQRIGYGSLGTGFYAEAYKDVLDKPAKDWAHTNAIFYIPEEDAAILSSYNQDVVYKIDLKTGKLVWLLGNHGGWDRPWRQYLLDPTEPDFLWNYHQHAAKLTPQGTVLMYDNGTHRARPFEEKRSVKENFSRAVEFRVNEKEMTVSRVWSYGGPDDEIFFSSFICDTDWLPLKENVLVTDGGRVKSPDGSDAGNPVGGRHWARIFEVTHTQPAEKVFEVVIDEPDMGWAVYRSERVRGLIP